MNSEVSQATTSKIPIRIDPRMKRKMFLVDRLVCSCVESKMRHQNGNHRDFLASISIKMSGPKFDFGVHEVNSCSGSKT